MIGAARQPEGSFVEASAGTGKTRELVRAIAEAIAGGIEVSRIVAVTFTHQAAGEMKLRVREALAAQATEQSRRALQALDQAFIGTIHAFCAMLLRRRPVEACVDPDFIELDEHQALALFTTVFNRWLEGRLDPPSRTLARGFARYTREGSAAALRSAAWALATWRDLDVPWEKRPVDLGPRAVALLVEAQEMVALWPERERQFHRALLADAVARLGRARAGGVWDDDEAEAELVSLRSGLRNVRLGKTTGAGPAWDEFYGRLRSFAADANADLASHLRDELWEAVTDYGREKQRLGCLDFTDLLLHARDLLRHSGAREELRGAWDLFFVDEFQDTDPLQAEILTALAPAERLFVVGDPKQSIYRFRRAEPKVYADVRDRLARAGIDRRTLDVSHRSNAAIQEFVNSAFAAMPEYLPITGGPPALDTQPSIVALPPPKPYDGDRITPAQVVQCTPAVVAAFIRWLLSNDCGWTVRDNEARRPIRAGDVCILFRRVSNEGRDLTEDYVRALEARDIDHVLVGSKGLHGREETLVLRTALRAIESPDDELSVYAVLRGPLFGIPDNTLFRCRESGVRLRPTAPWPDDPDLDFAPIHEALSILLELHRGRNSQPVAGTIRRLLEAIRGHAIFAFHKGGARKLANIHRLAELARQAESRGATSFRSFVEYLEGEAASGEAAEAPVIEQQSAGVRLMTVHKAKGLQFPVVILADPTANLVSPFGCSRWINLDRNLCAQRLLGCAPRELIDHEAEEDRAEREEGERVAYVAATRAEELLVVCALGDSEWPGGWLSPLYESLYPPAAQRRLSAPAPGCPAFGEETVLNAPLQPGEPQIRPGLHTPRSGKHQVVWFDPAVLTLDVRRAAGTEREHLLRGSSDEVQAGIQRYRAWQATRQSRLETGSTPSLRAQAATEAGVVPGIAENVPVEVVRLKPEGPRPSGRRFGRLVHAILEHAGVGAVALGRGMGAGREEIEGAERAAQAVLRHPLLSPEGATLWREYPLMLRLDDGTLVEGRADVVRDEGESIVVIDYKTDSGRGTAIRQLQIYAEALRRISGKPVRGVILEI